MSVWTNALKASTAGTVAAVNTANQQKDFERMYELEQQSQSLYGTDYMNAVKEYNALKAKYADNMADYDNFLALKEDAKWTSDAIAADPSGYQSYLKSLTPEQQVYVAKYGTSMDSDGATSMYQDKATIPTGDIEYGTSTTKNKATGGLLATAANTFGNYLEQPLDDTADVAKGAWSTVTTGDVSDTTDALSKAGANGATLNLGAVSDKAADAADYVDAGTKVVTGGTNSATQAAFNSAAAVNYLAKGDWHNAALELAKAGVSVDEAVLGSGTVDINYLMDEINKSNTGESNGAGTVGLSQNALNAMGAAITDDSGFSAFNTSDLKDTANDVGGAVNDAVDKAKDAASGGDGSGSDSGSDWFSNYNKVNSIVQNGSNSALEQYKSNNAEALAPVTEAKDAYNYKQQLDNFNEFNNNYNSNMQQLQADLEGNKNAAENWQTYMNPLTEYLNQQLAENAKGSAGSMLNSSATQNSINKAITDNTAAQYQNSVNTAMNQATQNANITQQQASNLNSMMGNEQQRLENNVTPTTDWTSYMTDAADTQYNNQMNVVNTQAGLAAQQPTTAETWADYIKTGISAIGAIGSVI